MQIFFKTRRVELYIDEKNFIARRIENLEKFFSPDAHAYIDVEQTRVSNSGDDLFYVSITIEDGKYNYFADEYGSDIRKAFDSSYGDIYRMIRNDRSKSRKLLRSTGRTIKRILIRRN